MTKVSALTVLPKKAMKTSKKALFSDYNPLEGLLNKERTLEAVKECVQDNDLDGVIEMVKIYLQARRYAKPPRVKHTEPVRVQKEKSKSYGIGLKAKSNRSVTKKRA